MHRPIFEAVFNIGKRVIDRCNAGNLVDKRAGASGRKPYQMLCEKIENFWLNEVDKEPSHYDSTSKKQHCVGVSSVAHGWLIFLARYFPAKYNECVVKNYFPRVNKRVPDDLQQQQDVPIIACEECIQASTTKELTQVVCPHMPKFPFFQSVAHTFNLGFKRPGSDQCEKCNSHHNRIALLRAMGRHNAADDVEDKLTQHQQDLATHHNNAAAFISMRNDLQHTAKRGNGPRLTKYDYDPNVPWNSKDVIQSISMDAGSGGKTPFCRVGFTYFSRTLVTNFYHIVDHGLRHPSREMQPYHTYLWNDQVGGKGPSEIMSIFLDFMQAARTGATRLVVEVDGCSGQAFNQYLFALFQDLVDPTSELCRAMGATEGSAIFTRIDVFRGEVGHTFMSCDRVHGHLRVGFRKEQYIEDIRGYERIVKKLNRGLFRVRRIEPGDGFFKDMKKYVEQSYKLGGQQQDIDGNGIATRRRHWVNFGLGPSGGDNSVLTRHKYGAWRLRCTYDPSEVPCEIVVARHTRPNRAAGEYSLLYPTLGDFQTNTVDFVPFESPSLHDKWREPREIVPEKVRDTHKLACLGLPDELIHLWPCPDPASCKLDRCPERARAVQSFQV